MSDPTVFVQTTKSVQAKALSIYMEYGWPDRGLHAALLCMHHDTHTHTPTALRAARMHCV